MENEKSKTFDRPYTRIMISRRILEFLWIEFWSIDRYDDDPLEFFWRTRDHYKRMWGPENVRLRLYWNGEIFDGNGKPILT